MSKSARLSRVQTSYVITCQRIQACHGTKRAMSSRVKEYKLVTEPKELWHHVSESTSLSRNQKSYVITYQRVQACHGTKRAMPSCVKEYELVIYIRNELSHHVSKSTCLSLVQLSSVVTCKKHKVITCPMLNY